MIDVVLITAGNRDKLLDQTIRTLQENSTGVMSSMKIVAEPPDPENWKGVGALKNEGAATSPRKGQLLLFSDDDMYWLPNWDKMMRYGMAIARSTILGGWSHPYNPPGKLIRGGGIFIGEVNAVSGNALMMSWKDWERFGGFVANATGPGQSEDWELSQRVLGKGERIACIYPPVAIHCGMMNVMGKPAVGHAEMREIAVAMAEDCGLKDLVLE